MGICSVNTGGARVDLHLGEYLVLTESVVLNGNPDDPPLEARRVCWVDVAQSDGEIDAMEVAVLKKIATTLGVSAREFGIE